MTTEAKKPDRNIINLFIEGAKQGWGIAINSMLPNVLMAFVLIRILDITGILDIVGRAAGPIMALWGLPGEGLIVLMACFMSIGGGVGVAASLAADAKLDATHLMVLAPAFMLMGSYVQYIGRCLGTADANRKYWGWTILISICNGLLGMWMMRLFLLFF
jgi:spore maturation protein SpmB